MNEIIKFSDVASAIIEVRGEKVILDSSVAKLYGVETMRINEAVKNNPDKFPDGYVISLTKEEKRDVIENFDNPKVKFSPKLPKAFTEKGLYMLATILKSPEATRTTIAIVETFAKLRSVSWAMSALLNDHENEAKQANVMDRIKDVITGMLDTDMETISSETSFELNLMAALKIKHTIRKQTEPEP